MSEYISIFLKVSNMIYILTKDLRPANVWMICYSIGKTKEGTAQGTETT